MGRVQHLPAARLAAVVDGMCARGLIGASGWLSDAELGQLIADLEPISAALDAAGSR